MKSAPLNKLGERVQTTCAQNVQVFLGPNSKAKHDNGDETKKTSKHSTNRASIFERVQLYSYLIPVPIDVGTFGDACPDEFFVAVASSIPNLLRSSRLRGQVGSKLKGTRE